MSYIEREALLEHKRKMKGFDLSIEYWSEAVLCEDIRNAPTADVAPVRHGEWKYNRGQAPNEKAYFCSLCACGESNYGKDKYCPECGAKMDGERREE